MHFAPQYAAQVSHHTRRRCQPRRGRCCHCRYWHFAQPSKRVCCVRQDGPPQAIVVGRLARQGRTGSGPRTPRSDHQFRSSSYPVVRHALQVRRSSLGSFAYAFRRDLVTADRIGACSAAPTPVRVPDLVRSRFRSRCPGCVPVSLLVRTVRPLARVPAPATAAVLVDHNGDFGYSRLGRSFLFCAEWVAGPVPRHLCSFPRPDDDVVLSHLFGGTEPSRPFCCGLPLAAADFVPSHHGNVPPLAATHPP